MPQLGVAAQAVEGLIPPSTVTKTNQGLATLTKPPSRLATPSAVFPRPKAGAVAASTILTLMPKATDGCFRQLDGYSYGGAHGKSLLSVVPALRVIAAPGGLFLCFHPIIGNFYAILKYFSGKNLEKCAQLWRVPTEAVHKEKADAYNRPCENRRQRKSNEAP
jgi:hypothetical protein